MLEELRRPDLPNWKNVEEALWSEWSKSGSAAMDLLLERGRAAIEAEDWGMAIAHLTALTDHAPGFAEGFNARALAYFKSGLFGPALDDLARALTLNPDHFAALMGLGTILEDTGRDAAALAAYRAARAIHPHDPDLEEAVNRLEPKVSGQAL
ncbi:tetratricopeptide repeat protein [Rhodovulum bhavnagarense]|uniref:Tetratricopeptide repeat protein n=1 Tax=Rhodovulum bhavnagarense TaxID=992286 RepID=A0A4R2RGX9_9RHOB|nr:tetratricopeptide repeat protein [Rhodovulum bhavnagarense]